MMMGKTNLLLVVSLAIVAGGLAQTDEELIKSTEEGVKVLAALCKTQQGTVADLVTALESGDMNNSKKAYIAARPQYEQIEVLAGSFEDEDTDIDSRPYAHDLGEEDPGFKGFHVIEYMLFRDGDVASAVPVAKELVKTVDSLCAKLDAIDPKFFNPITTAEGMIGLALEIPGRKISSEEETWSDMSILIFRENFKGIHSVVMPFLNNVKLQKVVKKDIENLYQDAVDLFDQIDPENGFAGGSDGEARRYSTLTMAERAGIVRAAYRYGLKLRSVFGQLGQPSGRMTRHFAARHARPRERFFSARQDTEGDTEDQTTAVMAGVKALADECKNLKTTVADLLASMEVSDPDVDNIKTKYIASRPSYEQIEVLAPSFEDLDSDIDARPYSFELGEFDDDYKGFHKIEYLLYREIDEEGSFAMAKEYTEGLVKSVDDLCDVLNGASGDAFNVANSWDGILGLAFEIPAKKISSEEETWSDGSVLIFRENYKGINKQVVPFYPLFPAARVEEIKKAYEEMKDVIDKVDPENGFAGGDMAQARPYSDLSTEERKMISDAAYKYANQLRLASEELQDEATDGKGADDDDDDDGTASPTAAPTASPAPTSSPAPTASPTPEPTEEPVCFPGSATVVLQDGSERTMASLEVGDHVLTSKGFSEVFMFGHRDADAEAEFVSISASNMERSLILSGSHFVPTSAGLKAAEDIEVGEEVYDASGSLRKVVKVEVVKATGLYNPHTHTGDVVVDGIRASCFTNVISPMLAALLLQPFRALRALGFGPVTFLYHRAPAILLRSARLLSGK